ncbi:MAG: hypothetical protein PHE58_07445, partial [Candidatus Omnitrophica bacterium]|nr:hypothetical protein [Candidatus Omnitrophota bacterium]
ENKIRSISVPYNSEYVILTPAGKSSLKLQDINTADVRFGSSLKKIGVVQYVITRRKIEVRIISVKNYSGYGIGTALLSWFIDFARKNKRWFVLRGINNPLDIKIIKKLISGAEIYDRRLNSAIPLEKIDGLNRDYEITVDLGMPSQRKYEVSVRSDRIAVVREHGVIISLEASTVLIGKDRLLVIKDGYVTVLTYEGTYAPDVLVWYAPDWRFDYIIWKPEMDKQNDGGNNNSQVSQSTRGQVMREPSPESRVPGETKDEGQRKKDEKKVALQFERALSFLDLKFKHGVYDAVRETVEKALSDYSEYPEYQERLMEVVRNHLNVPLQSSRPQEVFSKNAGRLYEFAGEYDFSRGALPEALRYFLSSAIWYGKTDNYKGLAGVMERVDSVLTREGLNEEDPFDTYENFLSGVNEKINKLKSKMDDYNKVSRNNRRFLAISHEEFMAQIASMESYYVSLNASVSHIYELLGLRYKDQDNSVKAKENLLRSAEGFYAVAVFIKTANNNNVMILIAVLEDYVRVLEYLMEENGRETLEKAADAYGILAQVYQSLAQAQKTADDSEMVTRYVSKSADYRLRQARLLENSRETDEDTDRTLESYFAAVERLMEAGNLIEAEEEAKNIFIQGHIYSAHVHEAELAGDLSLVYSNIAKRAAIYERISSDHYLPIYSKKELRRFMLKSANSYIQAARVAQKTEYASQANDFVDKALEMFEILGNKEKMIESLKDSAVFNMRRDDFRKSADYSIRLGELFEQKGDKVQAAWAYDFAAVALYKMAGFSEQEVAMLEKSSSLWEETGKIEEAAHSLKMLAIAYANLNYRREAAESNQKSFEYYVKINSWVEAVSVADYAMNLYGLLGEFIQAENIKNKALAELEKRSRQSSVGKSADYAAHILQMQMSWAKFTQRFGFKKFEDGGEVSTMDDGRWTIDENSKSYELNLSADNLVAGAMSYHDGGFEKRMSAGFLGDWDAVVPSLFAIGFVTFSYFQGSLSLKGFLISAGIFLVIIANNKLAQRKVSSYIVP